VIAALGCLRCHRATPSPARVAEVARGGWRFIVWFDTAGRRLSAAQFRDPVMRGKTRKVRFVSDRGVELDGTWCSVTATYY
jgi:hypothetical protein